MVDRQLRFVLTGQDQGASAVLGKTAEAGESASKRIGTAFSTMGSKIGGELGEFLNVIGEGFNKLGEAGVSMGAKLTAAGGGVLSLGVAMMSMSSGDVAAKNQLKAAIDATGQAYGDYSEEIEKAIKSGAAYNHNATDVQNALQKITVATNDPSAALEHMGLVEDMAAAKHETLTDASAQLVQMLAGNAKGFRTYGVTLDKTIPLQERVAQGLDEVAVKLKGQAAAAADTFTGKLNAMKTELENNVMELSAKFGPAITAFGSVMLVAGSAMQVMAARTAARTAATAADATASVASTTATTAQAAATTDLDASMVALREAEAAATAANERLGAAMAGTAAETAAAGAATGAAAEETGAMGAGMMSTLGPVAALTAAIFILGPELDKLGAAGTAVGTTFTGFEGTTKQLTAAMVQGGDAMQSNEQQIMATQLAQNGLADKAAKAGLSVGNLTYGLTGNDEAFQTLIASWRASGKPSQDTIDALSNMRAAFDGATEKAKGMTSTASDLSGVITVAGEDMTVTATSTDQLSAYMKAGQKAATDYNGAIDSLSTSLITADEMELKYKDSVQSATDAIGKSTDSVDKSTGGFNDNSQAGRTNKETVMDLITAANQHAEAVYKQTGSIEQANAALAQDEAQMMSVAGTSPVLQGAVQQLINKYAAVPGQVTTTMVANVANAINNLDDFESHILGAEVVARNARATIAAGYGPGGYASGGSPGDGWSVVGEAGPELMHKSGNTVRIFPHGQSQAMVGDQGGGGGQASGGDTYISINLNGAVLGTDTSVARAIAGQLEQYVGTGGTIRIGSGVR